MTARTAPTGPASPSRRGGTTTCCGGWSTCGAPASRPTSGWPRRSTWSRPSATMRPVGAGDPPSRRDAVELTRARAAQPMEHPPGLARAGLVLGTRLNGVPWPSGRSVSVRHLSTHLEGYPRVSGRCAAGHGAAFLSPTRAVGGRHLPPEVRCDAVGLLERHLPRPGERGHHLVGQRGTHASPARRGHDEEAVEDERLALQAAYEGEASRCVLAARQERGPSRIRQRSVQALGAEGAVRAWQVTGEPGEVVAEQQPPRSSAGRSLAPARRTFKVGSGWGGRSVKSGMKKASACREIADREAWIRVEG